MVIGLDPKQGRQPVPVSISDHKETRQTWHAFCEDTQFKKPNIRKERRRWITAVKTVSLAFRVARGVPPSVSLSVLLVTGNGNLG